MSVTSEASTTLLIDATGEEEEIVCQNVVAREECQWIVLEKGEKRFCLECNSIRYVTYSKNPNRQCSGRVFGRCRLTPVIVSLDFKVFPCERCKTIYTECGNFPCTITEGLDSTRNAFKLVDVNMRCENALACKICEIAMAPRETPMYCPAAEIGKRLVVHEVVDHVVGYAGQCVMCGLSDAGDLDLHRCCKRFFLPRNMWFFLAPTRGRMNIEVKVRSFNVEQIIDKYKGPERRLVKALKGLRWIDRNDPEIIENVESLTECVIEGKSHSIKFCKDYKF